MKGPPPLLSDTMTSTRMLAGSLAALAFALLVFAALPGLDVRAAAFFYLGEGRFAGQTPLGETARRVLGDLPFALFGLDVLLVLLRRLAGWRVWAPNAAGVAMMALSLALGPGLLVNVVLKDHSHRPRPVQVVEFGGPDTFRPVLQFDGACRRNCSFVSGEGATGFWTLAPALLVPAPWRPAAIAAALALGAATGLLRMAFGGHFLSDTAVAALLTWVVIVLCWRLALRITGRPPGGADDAAARPPSAAPAEQPCPASATAGYARRHPGR